MNTKYIKNIMMEFIKNEVCGSEFSESTMRLNEENLTELYAMSKSQDVAHLIGDSLKKNGLLIHDGEVKKKFEKQIMAAVYRYENINYELKRVKKVLNDEKIPFIALKGAVIRMYYPEPWQRTSCDIDILVHSKDIDRATGLFVNEGKEKNKIVRGSHDVGIILQSGVHLELHYGLIESGRIGSAEKILEDVWSYANAKPGTYEYVLCDEMYYYYHLAHMAKHVENGGCGVRPFIDLWILNHKVEFNKESRENLIRDGGLYKFAVTAENLSEYWFGNEQPSELLLDFEEYIISSGTYGNIENHSAVKQVQRNGRAKYILTRIWMPYEKLIIQYPCLKDRKYLQPFFEFTRWCRLFKSKTMKRRINELKVNTKISDKKVAKTNKLLSELGILS